MEHNQTHSNPSNTSMILTQTTLISSWFRPEIRISTFFSSFTSTFSPSTTMTFPSTTAETPLIITERDSEVVRDKAPIYETTWIPKLSSNILGRCTDDWIARGKITEKFSKTRVRSVIHEYESFTVSSSRFYQLIIHSFKYIARIRS